MFLSTLSTSSDFISSRYSLHLIYTPQYVPRRTAGCGAFEFSSDYTSQNCDGHFYSSDFIYKENPTFSYTSLIFSSAIGVTWLAPFLYSKIYSLLIFNNPTTSLFRFSFTHLFCVSSRTSHRP